MVKRDIKKALGSSLKAEEAAVKNRFELAEAFLGNRNLKESENLNNEETNPNNSTSAAPDAPLAEKVIRDSFTMPTEDYQLITIIRERCLKQGIVLNKSETLRAGLLTLFSLPDAELIEAVNSVKKVKSGRPKFI